jgi:hypothetical protein
MDFSTEQDSFLFGLGHFFELFFDTGQPGMNLM